MVAIGGNSLITDPQHQTVEDQYLAASEARAGKYLATVSDAARSLGVECATVLVRSDDPHEALPLLRRMLNDAGHEGARVGPVGAATARSR